MLTNTARVVAWVVGVGAAVLPAARAGVVSWPAAGADHWAAAGTFADNDALVFDRATGAAAADVEVTREAVDPQDADFATARAWQQTLAGDDLLTSGGGFDVVRGGERAAAQVGLVVPFDVGPGGALAKLSVEVVYTFLGNGAAGDAVGAAHVHALDGAADTLGATFDLGDLPVIRPGGARGTDIGRTAEQFLPAGRYELSVLFDTGVNLIGGAFDGGDRLDYALRLAFEPADETPGPPPPANPVPVPTAAAAAGGLFAACGVVVSLQRPRRARA